MNQSKYTCISLGYCPRYYIHAYFRYIHVYFIDIYMYMLYNRCREKHQRKQKIQQCTGAATPMHPAGDTSTYQRNNPRCICKYTIDHCDFQRIGSILVLAALQDLPFCRVERMPARYFCFHTPKRRGSYYEHKQELSERSRYIRVYGHLNSYGVQDHPQAQRRAQGARFHHRVRQNQPPLL